MHPLIELVSEANAEVVYEEKDIEEVVSVTSLLDYRAELYCDN